MEACRTSSKSKEKSMKRKKSETCSSTSTQSLEEQVVERHSKKKKKKKHHKKSANENEKQGKKRRKKSSPSTTEKGNKSNLDCSRRERDETEENVEHDERAEELGQRLKPAETREVGVEWSNPLHSKWRFRKEEIKLLQKQGVKIKAGNWSKIETETLQKNMEHYLQTNGLTDPAPLIYRKDYENKDSQMQAKNSQFYAQLAKGINRPLFHVYKRVLRMYDPTNYCGKWSPSDTDTLLRLHAIYGDQWTTIGKHLGRSGMAVNHKYLILQKSPGYCLWTDEEIDLLNGAVRAATHTEFGSQIYSSINWSEVSSFVGSRTPEQCRTKWFKDVCWMSGDGSINIKWSSLDDIILIERLYAGNEYDENDIDWPKMAEGFSNSPSREWLRLRWSTLKKAVPNSTELDYEDVLDYLYGVHRSVLKENSRRELDGEK